MRDICDIVLESDKTDIASVRLQQHNLFITDYNTSTLHTSLSGTESGGAGGRGPSLFAANAVSCGIPRTRAYKILQSY